MDYVWGIGCFDFENSHFGKFHARIACSDVCGHRASVRDSGWNGNSIDRFNLKASLRQYKEKFHPECRAKYLAYPGSFTLPRVFGNIATLVSGDIVQTLRK
jgi:hypothetical protein